MLSDPEIVCTCDKCGVYQESFGLTALAQHAYDERNIPGALRHSGWLTTPSGEHICPDCQEEAKVEESR